jgi:hypothetical protein
MKPVENCKRTEPMIPVDHPAYIWRSHADVDVQRTWRRYGWNPKAELQAQQPLRMVKKGAA